MNVLEKRVKKLEDGMPRPITKKAPSNGENIMSALEKVQADIAKKEAFLASASAAERYRFWQNEIRKCREKLAAPFEDKRPDLPGFALSLFRGSKACAKSTLANYFYELRGCEIELLQAADYRGDELVAEHKNYRELPWQWAYTDNHLPETAQEIIAQALLN